MWAFKVGLTLGLALQYVAATETETETEMETGFGGMLYNVAVDPDIDLDKHDWSKGISMNTKKGGTMIVKPGFKNNKGLAWARWENTMEKNGWSNLYVITSRNKRGGVAASGAKIYSAGFLEGLMTATPMSQFYSNVYQMLLKNEDNAKAIKNIRVDLQKQLNYLQKQCNILPGTMTSEPVDPYWKHARYILFQLWGIKDGYNWKATAKAVRTIDMVDMLMINSHALLPELVQAFSPKASAERRAFQRPQSFLQNMESMSEMMRKMTQEVGFGNHTFTPSPTNVSEAMQKEGQRIWEAKARKGHCSALVRLAPEDGDVLIGHSTWDDYDAMIRVFKLYDFHLPDSFCYADKIFFSSYPGCVASGDNYYQMSSGLVALDTSLEILNPKVYDRVPEFPANPHIPNFIHHMVVNRMSRTGAGWTSLYSERNAGIGNSQWMIMDYNLFVPGKPLPDKSFWVLEQIPGIIQKGDMSGRLRSQGYWASYNRPYFDKVRMESGHTAAQSKYGALFSWDGNPRAAIMKTLGVTVGGLMPMRNAMRRNRYPDEGTVPSGPGLTVSARFDLDGFDPIPNGAIDAKIINHCMMKRMQCQAISGPTHQTQAVFQFKNDDGSEVFPGWVHLGLPNRWDFDWVQMTPTGQLTPIVDISC